MYLGECCFQNYLYMPVDVINPLSETKMNQKGKYIF